MDDDPSLLDPATSTMSLLLMGGAALGLGAFVLRRYRRKAKPEPAATNIWDLEGGGLPLEPRLHRRVHQSPVETYAAPPRSLRPRCSSPGHGASAGWQAMVGLLEHEEGPEVAARLALKGRVGVDPSVAA